MTPPPAREWERQALWRVALPLLGLVGVLAGVALFFVWWLHR